MKTTGDVSLHALLEAQDGQLAWSDFTALLDMCQIATCHERGERCVRQLGHYVAQGRTLLIRVDEEKKLEAIDDLEKLRALILRYDAALDIATGLSLKPAPE